MSTKFVNIKGFYVFYFRRSLRGDLLIYSSKCMETLMIRHYHNEAITFCWAFDATGNSPRLPSKNCIFSWRQTCDLTLFFCVVCSLSTGLLNANRLHVVGFCRVLVSVAVVLKGLVVMRKLKTQSCTHCSPMAHSPGGNWLPRSTYYWKHSVFLVIAERWPSKSDSHNANSWVSYLTPKHRTCLYRTMVQSTWRGAAAKQF